MKKIYVVLIIIICVFLIKMTKIINIENKNSQNEYLTEITTQEIFTEHLAETTTQEILIETRAEKEFYDNFYKENPYLLEEPINDAIYNIIKQKHIKAGFSGTFKKGNNRDFYLKKYRKLLNNEVPLVINGSDFFNDKLNEPNNSQEDFSEEKILLKNYNYLKDMYSSQKISDCIFRFFDIDNDGNPELCIENVPDFIYIIKYEEDKDRFVIWDSYEKMLYVSIFGTEEIGRELSDGAAWFTKLNKIEENEYTTWFKYIPYSEYGECDKICYLVSLPINKKNTEINDVLKKASSYSEDNIDYFRVTEEQFRELYSLYYVKKIGIEDITYSYEELIQ